MMNEEIDTTEALEVFEKDLKDLITKHKNKVTPRYAGLVIVNYGAKILFYHAPSNMIAASLIHRSIDDALIWSDEKKEEGEDETED